MPEIEQLDAVRSTSSTQSTSSDGFTVTLDSYSGPFEVLLSLLAQRKLELTEISLSEITDDFLTYVKGLHMVDDADQISSFIDVASVLVEAKSASLIPHDDDDDFDLSIESLRERDLLFARLLQYRAFKQAGEDFRVRLATNSGRFIHPAYVDNAIAAMLPELAWSVKPEDLARMAALALSNAPRSEVRVDQLHIPLVNLRQQAGIVRDKLRTAGNKVDVTFDELTQDTHETLEIVARFLALLAFFKQGVVQFKQEGPFESLHVRWLEDNDSGENTDVVAVSEEDFA